MLTMRDSKKQVLTAMIQINGLSPWPLLSSGVVSPEDTAILFLPGGNGHEYRQKEIVRHWRDGKLAKYLFFSGRSEEPPYTRKYVTDLAQVSLDDPRIFFTPKARHTYEETEWAMGLINELFFIRHIIIGTAAYHLPRGFLTLLHSLEKRKWEREIIISSLPAYNLENPSVDFTGFSWTGNTGILGEMQRILKYQQKPYEHVASIPSFWEYLKWRLSPVFKK